RVPGRGGAEARTRAAEGLRRALARAAAPLGDRGLSLMAESFWLGGGAHPARCHALVHALRARGLGHGDAVAVLLPNGEPLLSTLLAVMQAGWHWVPINTSLTASEVAWILADSGARAFVAHERHGEWAAGPPAGARGTA